MNGLLTPSDIDGDLDAVGTVAEDFVPNIWERDLVNEFFRNPGLELGEGLVWVGLWARTRICRWKSTADSPECCLRFLRAARATQGIDDQLNSHRRRSKIVEGVSDAVRLAALATV
ncbi:unnamed protein product [Schistocephalus solidus]|uniref:Transposase n=1 Tax=Schistocephalus solidus TaxID=70667 RepID=A0A183THC4_SCHSO|nr:unnamed protein product [Schistocephalus solidus]